MNDNFNLELQVSPLEALAPEYDFLNASSGLQEVPQEVPLTK